MKSIHFWTLNSVLCLSLFGSLKAWEHSLNSRQPASMDTLSLEIKEIQLPSHSKVLELRNVSLRVTFNQDNSIDVLGGRKLNLASGQMTELNMKIPVDASWVRNDQLAFNLEFVQEGLIDVVIVRCAQVSKKISHYNRNYQCFIPGDNVALMTYRLGNEQVGVSGLAQN